MLLMLFRYTGEAPPPTPAPSAPTRYSCNEAVTAVSASAGEGITASYYGACLDGEGT